MKWFARPDAPVFAGRPVPAEVLEFHAGLPGYAPTPLVELPTLAGELGVGRVFVKDESSRLGLPAFKVLGVTWAVHRLLTRWPHGPLRLVTATDGNHGRAVARTARLLGHRALVLVADGVHPDARAAISAEGADVVPVAGNYDDAVRQASQAAREPLSVLVQDTAWPGYEEVPGWIVEGYSTLFVELDAQLEATPDLVVVPVGVGSLAQAAVNHYAGRGTKLLAVEPETAACVLASLVRRQRVSITTSYTTMVGLTCGTPSSLAWPVLRDGLDAAIAVTDEDSARAKCDLAALGVPAGPCGAAALAGIRRAPSLVGADSTVVLLSTEGADANPA
jgi:diaminopropionate ammonia-lyase